MIKILKDKALSDKNGIEGLNLFDNDEKIGGCMYRFGVENVEILKLEVKDSELKNTYTDALVRAVLSTADFKGKKIGICKNNDLFEDLINVGFVKTGDFLSVDIEEFWKSGCGNCK